MSVLSDIQFSYRNKDEGKSSLTHVLEAHLHDDEGRRQVGNLVWNSQRIGSINVAPDMLRQGIGTAMWHEGHRLAAEDKSIPQPKHSADRTNVGDAWARNVGGRLPRRKK